MAGIGTSIKHFGPSFEKMGKTLNASPSFDLEESADIIRQMNEKVPLDNLQVRIISCKGL